MGSLLFPHGKTKNYRGTLPQEASSFGGENAWGNRFNGGIDRIAVARHIAVVGPYCSRPAYPRHIAQALQLARAPGGGLFGDMSNPHKPFVRSRHSNPGIRRPPGELPRAAKRCLTPKGDEKCLATTRFTPPPLITIRV
jgi:hypothetical protein